MLVVVDSRKFKKLMDDVRGLQRYESTSDQYDAGTRDGSNSSVIRIHEMLTSFWNELTKE